MTKRNPNNVILLPTVYLVFIFVITSTIGFSGCNPNQQASGPNNGQNNIPKAAEPKKESLNNSAVIAVVNEFLTQAKAGRANSDSMTLEFKKVVGEPFIPSDREKGYSESAANDWVNRVGSRLQSTSFTDLGSGFFEIDRGTLKMVQAESKWKVAWFHAGRPQGIEKISGGEISKKFAVATFLDALFTNNFELCEAALSAKAKANLAPPIGKDVGYNRGTLRSKLRSLTNSANGYSLNWSSANPVVSLLNGSEKKMTLTLEQNQTQDSWQIGSIE